MGPRTLSKVRGRSDSGVMTPRIVILGGGTGGTATANRLRRRLAPGDAEIVVVDADDRHVYQPGLLLVPFGLATPTSLVRSRRDQLAPGVEFRESEVDRVDAARSTVLLAGGDELDYDLLVVATGATLAPEETDGLCGPGWMDSVGTFYSLEGASALAGALARFEGGRLVVNVVDMPIKCPVAPLEFCFLADWFFEQRGIREGVHITYATPLDGAFTKPLAARALAGLLEDKGIELVTEFNTGEVHGDEGRMVAFDGRELAFDLAAVVPLHAGAAFVGRSEGLGDDFGFVTVDPHTLQSTVSPKVFALGDAADVPTSKAGSVAHFEAEVLVENLCLALRGAAPSASFDGHTNCFIETGHHKALLIDFNYDTEPRPGRFPARLGLPLLKESRLNHLGKQLFELAYWHALLPGHDLPGISSPMPTRGKRMATPS